MTGEIVGIRIAEIDEDQLHLYDAIPSRFTVESVLHVEPKANGLGGFDLTEYGLSEPYEKDYDGGGEHAPSTWPSRFPETEWGLLLARDGDRAVGGAAVAHGGAVFPMSRFQPEDLAVLWDIRVHPDVRGRGIACDLFVRAAEWATERGFSQLGIETQNVNVPACRFYASRGCELGAIHRFGYAGCPAVANEAMLIWYFPLRRLPDLLVERSW